VRQADSSTEDDATERILEFVSDERTELDSIFSRELSSLNELACLADRCETDDRDAKPTTTLIVRV